MNKKATQRNDWTCKLIHSYTKRQCFSRSVHTWHVEQNRIVSGQLLRNQMDFLAINWIIRTVTPNIIHNFPKSIFVAAVGIAPRTRNCERTFIQSLFSFTHSNPNFALWLMFYLSACHPFQPTHLSSSSYHANEHKREKKANANTFCCSASRSSLDSRALSLSILTSTAL